MTNQDPDRDLRNQSTSFARKLVYEKSNPYVNGRDPLLLHMDRGRGDQCTCATRMNKNDVRK
jgi:hypothetical protein